MKAPIRLATALAFAAIAQPVLAQPAPSRAFTDGLADRTAWESWVGATGGEAQRGAMFWAEQRSRPKPGSCYGANGQSLGDFTAGCTGAQARLGPSDNRRRAESDYRSGWNAFRPTPTVAAELPTTLGGCRGLADAGPRLACYDRLPLLADEARAANTTPPIQAEPPPPMAAAARPQASTIGLATEGDGRIVGATRSMPPRDLSASSWLVDISTRLYDEAKAAALTAECHDDGLDVAVGVTLAFGDAVKSLSAADQAYANRVFEAGQVDGNQAVKHFGKPAACSWATSQEPIIEALAQSKASLRSEPRPTTSAARPPSVNRTAIGVLPSPPIQEVPAKPDNPTTQPRYPTVAINGQPIEPLPNPLENGSPGARAFAQAIYDIARSATLYTECIAAGNPSVAVTINGIFQDTMSRVPSLNVQAMYDNVFNAGLEAGNDALANIKDGGPIARQAVCAWLTPDRQQRLIEASHGGVWTP